MEGKLARSRMIYMQVDTIDSVFLLCVRALAGTQLGVREVGFVKLSPFDTANINQPRLEQ